MNFTLEATYENGMLRLEQSLPLRQHQRVRITLDTEASWVEQTAGMIRWTGGAETLERFAMDPELDPLEGP
jgi:predicted DNA-binding antitoxin AbrB/MazE fold protein